MLEIIFLSNCGVISLIESRVIKILESKDVLMQYKNLLECGVCIHKKIGLLFISKNLCLEYISTN